MSDTLEQRLIFRELLEKPVLVSHRTCEMILRRINVHILEMEDVLFHHNSAVMMPGHPAGKSAADGSEDDATDTEDAAIKEGQQKTSGVAALALVFRQFEFDPEKRMIIAGHTDTSGSAQVNFELSDQRAQNVLYLLTDARSEWAELSAKRHKIEDYQQIMQYAAKNRSWPCDPVKVDDKWGPDTEKALEQFVESYNAWAPDQNLSLLSTDLPRRVKNDPARHWPVELWEAVYEIYSDDMAKALEIPREELQSRRKSDVRFVDDSKPYVGCGESFPIDDAEKQNYRSQENRRVEILFFDKGEEPVINCPEVRNRNHKEEECPLWHGYHFIPLYINPDELSTMVFHLRFDYYDRVRQQPTTVPEIPGLSIRAFERRKVGTTEQEVPLQSSTICRDGTYYLRIRFTDALSNHPREKIHFEFALKDRWLYTEKKDSDPAVKTLTIAAYLALPLHERVRHYDLPAEFDSRNWQCSVGTTVGVFSQVVSQRTSASSPMRFGLDDIVLVDASGSQALVDRNGVATAANPHGAPQPLSARSRVRTLHVDPTDQSMKLFTWASDSDTDQQKYEQSLIRFETLPDGKHRNYVMGPPAAARVVVFCGQFYDVTTKRSWKTAAFNTNSGHVLGARAAVLEDPDVHRIRQAPPAQKSPVFRAGGIGDFEVHYLHGGGTDLKTGYSYLVVYWSAFVTRDTNPTGGTGDYRTPTDAEVEDFKSTGMANARNHWNKKGYEFRDQAGTHTFRVGLYFFFEAYEEFSFTTPAPPPVLKTDEVADCEAVFATAQFRDAVRNARGGVPKTVIFVVEEKKGSWMRSWRNATHYFSVMRLRIKTRKDDPARFTGFPFNEFGDPGQYGCIVIAHEIGHATGQVDDYMEKIPQSGTRGYAPNFGQFGFTAGEDWIADDNSNFADRVKGSDAWAIAHDAMTMMDKNGPIRMRHAWRFGHWLNEDGQTGGSLNGFLHGMRFAIHYPRASMRYYRTAQDRVNPWEYSHAATINSTAGRTVNVYINRTLDETRRKGGTDFKAILSARVLVAISYRNNGAHTWNAAQRKDWLENLYGIFLSADLEAGFKLDGGGGDLDPTIIRFIPGFENCAGEAAPAHNMFNYHVIVRRNSNDAIARTGKTITLGDQIPPRQLVNYFFNKPAADTTFTAADFTFIRTWFNGVAGGTFTLGAA